MIFNKVEKDFVVNGSLKSGEKVLWATQRVGKIAQVCYGFGVGVGTFPGIFSLLIGAEPIWCVPSWPVLDEQALTNMPAGSKVNTTSDMVIFFFIFLTFFVCCHVRGYSAILPV